MLEIATGHVGDTLRTVYTVKFDLAVYVSHAFQKKSKSGIKTSDEDIDLVRRRLKVAESNYKQQLS